MEDYEVIVELEGMTIQEAKLSYIERQTLPDEVFCGPNKTFPANDINSTMESLRKLNQDDIDINPELKEQIEKRLKVRAARFEVESEDNVYDESLRKWFKELCLE